RVGPNHPVEVADLRVESREALEFALELAVDPSTTVAVIVGDLDVGARRRVVPPHGVTVDVDGGHRTLFRLDLDGVAVALDEEPRVDQAEGRNARDGLGELDPALALPNAVVHRVHQVRAGAVDPIVAG